MGLTGGCMCGAVRYELQSEPFDCGWCHCRTCQLNSGAPAMVFASVPDGDFVWTSGAGQGAVGRFVELRPPRASAASAGRRFLMKVDHQPETVDFSVATLDDPDAVAPGFHIFWGSKIAWFEPRDDLPRHEGSGRIRAGSREPSRPRKA